jgi:hypothetical protein
VASQSSAITVMGDHLKDGQRSGDLELYSGLIYLLVDSTYYQGEGTVTLELYRSAGLIARCILMNTLCAHLGTATTLRLGIGDVGQVDATLIYSQEDHTSDECKLKVVLRLNSKGLRIYPNKKKKLFSLEVKVLNFHRFWRSSLCAETDKWKIRLCQIDQSSPCHEGLGEDTVNIFSHIVTVTRIDGNGFSLSEAEGFLRTFRDLIAFANGIPTFAGLSIGRSRDGNVVYREWSAPTSIEGGGRYSWIDVTIGSSFEEFIPSFFKLAESDQYGNACSEAIYWYLQSNAGGVAHGVDGGLILSHAALHRLSLSVLERGSTNAASDIRDAASKLGVPLSIPKELKACQAGKRKGIWSDTPDAINKMRNDLIHPRKNLTVSRSMVIPELWKLSQWYVELFILALSGYTGKYSRRTRKVMWIGETENVPWAGKKKQRYCL